MKMKRIITFFLVVIIAFSGLNAYSIDVNVTVPFVFDNDVAYSNGEVVMTVDSYSRGYVYSIDGKHIDTIENDGEVFQNGYIKVRLKGTDKWTVFTTQGQQALSDTYDYISVTEKDIAIVAKGTWRPPGVFEGKHGAVDLKTGKLIIPMMFDDLRLSVDGQLLYGHKFSAPSKYSVFDLKGQDITVNTPYVCISKYPNEYFTVCDPKTGLLGVADKEKKLCTRISYEQLGNIVFEGAVLVYKNGKWGVSSIDGSGKLLQPLEYNDAISYENGIYALKKWGSIRSSDINNVAIYYGDGALAFYNTDYSKVEGYCGDIIYMNRKSDDALVGVSKTGQVMVGPFNNGYICFSDPEYDFISIGRVNNDGYASSEGSMVVNRWGEIIAPYDVGDLLSDGKGGRGLSLLNIKSGKTVRMMADGTKLPELTTSPSIDYNRGWMFFNNENDTYVTDLFGNILIPKGTYARLDSSNYSGFYVTGMGACETEKEEVNQYLKLKPKIFGMNKNGKYGALELEDTPYTYKPHSWAENDIKEAVLNGLVPESQRRNWRDTCTRADFCRLIAPLLDTCGINSDSTTSFTDTNDKDILRAAALGIVNGTSIGKFSPNRPITRQEAAVILSRCAKVLSIEATENAMNFADKDTFAPWAKDSISYVNGIICGDNNQRVMQGVSSNRFSPLGYYTREQSIITILRLFNANNMK